MGWAMTTTNWRRFCLAMKDYYSAELNCNWNSATEIDENGCVPLAYSVETFYRFGNKFVRADRYDGDAEPDDTIRVDVEAKLSIPRRSFLYYMQGSLSGEHMYAASGGFNSFLNCCESMTFDSLYDSAVDMAEVYLNRNGDD